MKKFLTISTVLVMMTITYSAIVAFSPVCSYGESDGFICSFGQKIRLNPFN